jgi:hypothetical protein
MYECAKLAYQQLYDVVVQVNSWERGRTYYHAGKPRVSQMVDMLWTHLKWTPKAPERSGVLRFGDLLVRIHWIQRAIRVQSQPLRSG